MSSFANRRRSRRLRKKLHVGEFQEMGFDFKADLKVTTPEEQELLLDRFLTEVIEPRSLAMAGWITGGFIAYFSRGSASEDDRKAVGDWLSKCTEITGVQVGPLKDAWYSDDYGSI